MVYKKWRLKIPYSCILTPHVLRHNFSDLRHSLHVHSLISTENLNMCQKNSQSLGIDPITQKFTKTPLEIKKMEEAIAFSLSKPSDRESKSSVPPIKAIISISH